MDESGDLGFDFSKSKTSRHFVMTFIYVKNKNTIEKIVRKIFKKFSRTERRNHSGSLHAHKESSKTNRGVLKIFCERKAGKIFILSVDKFSITARARISKHFLYYEFARTLLRKILSTDTMISADQIDLIASRRETNKFLNNNFKKYLQDVEAERNYKIRVRIASPSSEKGLQIADVVSWAVFRKYEKNDPSFSNLIESEIVEEFMLDI